MKRIISHLYRLVFSLISYLPVKNKVIVFESFNGKLPSDNPYAIYQELKNSKLNLEGYWSIKKDLYNEAIKEYPSIKFIKRFSFKWMMMLPRAKYWIFNARMPIWLRKNKNTVYIQTWHGTPLKKLGIDIETIHMPGTTTNSYHQNFLQESSRWDYLIAPNEYSEQIFGKAFNYTNDFLRIGYPRNDKLILYRHDHQMINYLKNRILKRNNGKVYLYAPTWRDDYFVSVGKYKFKMPFDIEKILSCLNKNDILIIRPHYLVADTIDITGFEDNVYISKNEDINDIYLISDVLITDYSSVFFDYSILKRPIIFFPYDLDHYGNSLRGFYMEYSEMPGKIVYTEEELENYLLNQTPEYFSEKLSNFYDVFNQRETGHDATKVIELLNKINQ